jgi:hypothetical protein
LELEKQIRELKEKTEESTYERDSGAFGMEEKISGGCQGSNSTNEFNESFKKRLRKSWLN